MNHECHLSQTTKRVKAGAKLFCHDASSGIYAQAFKSINQKVLVDAFC